MQQIWVHSYNPSEFVCFSSLSFWRDVLRLTQATTIFVASNQVGLLKDGHSTCFPSNESVLYYNTS